MSPNLDSSNFSHEPNSFGNPNRGVPPAIKLVAVRSISCQMRGEWPANTPTCIASEYCNTIWDTTWLLRPCTDVIHRARLEDLFDACHRQSVISHSDGYQAAGFTNRLAPCLRPYNAAGSRSRWWAEPLLSHVADHPLKIAHETQECGICAGSRPA